MVHPAVRRTYLKGQLAIREIVALSPRTMAAITLNTLRMSRHELTWHRRRRASSLDIEVGTLTGATMTDDGDGMSVTYTRATLHVRAIADDVVRLAWGPGRAPYDIATRDTMLVPPTGVVVDVHDGRSASLRTSALRVVVDDDGVVVRDTSDAIRYCERTPLTRGTRSVLRRVLREGERLCGLGEQARGLDLTGASYRLWNRDPGGSWGTGQDPLYCSIPITVGLHASGPVWAFHENTHEARVTVGRVEHAPHGVAAEFDGGALVTYVAVGELDDVLTTATGMIGRPAMPPRWALGYHHCRWGWHNDAVVGEVVEGYAARGLPVSAFHLDIDHMDAFRVFTFDERRFGGVELLASRAAARGTRLVAIVDPAVRRDPAFSLYAQGIADGHFVTTADGEVDHGTVWPGWAAFPDFTRPATREWWGSHYEALTSRGIAGVWHDMNEPTSITLFGDRTLPRSDRHDLEGRGGDHAEAHNVYGLLMNLAGHEALSKAHAGARPFVLSRAGWAGIARHAWHWTADVESSASGLAQQVPTFLGLGLSGVPFTGSDIGGFSGIPTPELYVRWLELGVLSPFCRTHCVLGAPDREPWRFDPPFEAAISRLLRLRYRLLPHLYRLAEEAHRLGHPLWRPLDWPVDGAPSGTGTDASSFLLGNELLVVPVADPAAATVSVAVPAGPWRRLRLCDALDGHSGAEVDVEGGHVVEMDAPLGQPVVLQRRGTVVVLDDAWLEEATTLDPGHTAQRWTLHVCVTAEGRATGSGFEDAGDGEGLSRTDNYEVSTEQGALVVRWQSSGGYVRSGPVGVVVHGERRSTAAADGVDVAVTDDGMSTTVACDGPFDELVIR